MTHANTSKSSLFNPHGYTTSTLSSGDLISSHVISQQNTALDQLALYAGSWAERIVVESVPWRLKLEKWSESSVVFSFKCFCAAPRVRLLQHNVTLAETR